MHKARPALFILTLLPLLIMATGCGSASEPQATVTVTAAATTPAAKAPAADAPQVQGVPRPSRSNPPGPTAAPTRPVAEDFAGRRQNGYFFTSPSGNLECGLVEQPNMQYLGCQSGSMVDNMPGCDDSSSSGTPSISLARGDAGYPDCLAAGIFSDPGARVLEYGQTLELGAYECSSSTDGVRCLNTDDGHGFTAARKAFSGW